MDEELSDVRNQNETELSDGENQNVFEPSIGEDRDESEPSDGRNLFEVTSPDIENQDDRQDYQQGLGDGIVEIRDANVLVNATVLSHTKPKVVDVYIRGQHLYVPRLEVILSKIAENRIIVYRLRLEHLFRHPKMDLQKYLDRIMHCCRIKYYRGSMTEALPDDIEEGHKEKGKMDNDMAKSFNLRYLSVCLQKDEDAMTLYKYLRKRGRSLFRLEMNVSKVSPQVILPVTLKAVRELWVFIPDIGAEELDRAVDILMTMNQPIATETDTKCIDLLAFPRCSLKDPKDIRRLILSRLRDHLKVAWVVVFPSYCRPENPHEEESLQEMVKEMFQCPGGIKWGLAFQYEGEVDDMATWEDEYAWE